MAFHNVWIDIWINQTPNSGCDTNPLSMKCKASVNSVFQYLKTVIAFITFSANVECIIVTFLLLYGFWLLVRVFTKGLGYLVQSQVESQQRLKKCYLTSHLTLSIIRYGWSVKWCNPGKVVAPSTPRCSSYWKESFRLTLDYGRQLH